MIELIKMERVAPREYRAHVRREGVTRSYRFWLEYTPIGDEDVWTTQEESAIHDDLADYDDGHRGPRGAPASTELIIRIAKVMLAMERGEDVELPLRLDVPPNYSR